MPSRRQVTMLKPWRDFGVERCVGLALDAHANRLITCFARRYTTAAAWWPST